MANQTTTTVIDHTSDAGFRAWVAELITMLGAAGMLTQTADTGQINTATVARPAANLEGGYAIFRFNDAEHANAPIFIRFGFGSAAATTPRLQWTVGTATNGSGVVSGTGLAITTIASTLPTSTVVNYVTRVCVVPGFFGLMWKLGGATNALGFAAICRAVNSSQVPTAQAASIYTGRSGPDCTMARYGTGTTFSMAAGTYSLLVGGPTSSLVGGEAQVYKHYLTLPRVVPNMFLLTVIAAELGNNTSFTATPIGATSRTYISGGSNGVNQVGSAALTAHVLAMVWE